MKKQIVRNENEENRQFARLYKLQAKINGMVVEGLRHPQQLADALQNILDSAVYLQRVFKNQTFCVGTTTGEETLVNSGSDIFREPGGYANDLASVKTYSTRPIQGVVYEAFFSPSHEEMPYHNLVVNLPCWENQGQIISFVERHFLKFEPSVNVFFPMKDEFVVGVSTFGNTKDGKLGCGVRHLSDKLRLNSPEVLTSEVLVVTPSTPSN